MSVKNLLPNQHTPLHILYGKNDCCLCNTQKEINRLRDELSKKHKIYEALVKACEKMHLAMGDGGWGHSVLCNFSSAPITTPCNCGLNDMLWALKQIQQP